jgi:hypothetical protein
MARLRLDDTTAIDADINGESIAQGRVISGRAGINKDLGNGLRASAGITGKSIKAGDYKNTGITGGDVTLEKQFENGTKLRGKYNDNETEHGTQEKKIGAELEIPFKKGGKVSSASSRADGCAQRGKTRGRYI